MKKLLLPFLALLCLLTSGCIVGITPPGFYSTSAIYPLQDQVYYINNGPPPGGCRPWYGQIICDSGPGYREHQDNRYGGHRPQRRR